MARILTILGALVLCHCVSGNFLDLIANRLAPRGTRQLKTSNVLLEAPFRSKIEKLIEPHGYPVETHEIQTEDGYLLTVHRIPYGKGPKVANRPPVLIHHGIMASSDTWVLRGPEQDLAFILVDNGYDVWMSNARGNYYSRKHIYLDPDRDKKFWKFSFHEIGIYDLPATIDHILNVTNHKDLYYIGHSMGAGVFFVMASMKPEYNSKIRYMQGLAPGALIVHKPSPLMKFLISNGASFSQSLRSQGYYELFPLRQLNSRIGQAFCREDSPTQQLCLAAIFLVVGIDDQQMNNKFLPAIFDYFPAGTSLYQFLHFLQGIIKGDFRLMDYGEKINIIKYNDTEPPAYNLSKVIAPVSLHYGEGDFVITRTDVEYLAEKLPNVIGTFRVPFPYFNHLDFLWSQDSKTLLYDQLLTIMNKYK